MKKRNVALIILILILIYAVVGVYYNLTHQEKTPEVKEVDKVDKYNYVLKSNACSSIATMIAFFNHSFNFLLL